MTKKGPLGRAEVFYIQSFHSEKTAQELAKELDRAVSIVKKEIAKIEPVQEDKDKAKSQGSGSLMARQEGVVVMTENASSYADTTRKSGTKRSSQCVVRIRKDA
tara:strand:+ start:725 stop:1036 length:312 start_codon:yes stop_codon:yes gene_type:complete